MVMTRALLPLSILAAAVLLGAWAGAGNAPAAPRAQTEVLVQLDAPPLAYARTDADGARLERQQRTFLEALRDAVPGATVRWRYRTVVNGVAVVLDPSRVRRLASLPGVRRVFGSVTYRTLAGPDAATIHARALATPPLPTTGAGIKIGIIDDGIDQTHPFFAPAGHTMPAGFPKGRTAFTTAKVIVARAFPPAGSTWKYANRPFDPQESAHATHVAGIAAGNANTQADGARISGIAPRAYIGNYKALTVPTPDVGLDGNAPEIVKAIDMAVQDGMDVINLSIGEPEVPPERDVVALALDAAAAAGVVPVVAAGNDFDDFGPGSLASPGTSAGAITVGATTSGATPAMASFSSSGPTPLSLRLKPDVVAPGSGILSAQPGGRWGELSGTSMATPHVAGAVALLLERHPDWTPAQVKAALTVTARPVRAGEPAVPVTRAGAGLVDVAAADTPLLRPSPTSVSFGLVRPGTSVQRDVVLEDPGGGAGTWAVTFETVRSTQGATVAVPPAVTVPGTLPLDLQAGAVEGELAGVVVLRRDTVTRRIPVWGRVAAPHLVLAGTQVLARRGVYGGNTRGRPARVDTYRYPEVPPGGIVANRLAGPEQVFRVVVRRQLANIGVAITWHAPGVRVEPRIVAAGDENRLTGYAALPFNLNPYVDDFTNRTLAAGALLPTPGTYAVVFDSPTRSGAGAFRFRFWTNDVTPPAARVVARTVEQGSPVRLRASDGGSGIDPESLEATIAGRAVPVRMSDGEVHVSTDDVRPGRRRLELTLADYQETRNTENVARILPNTRVVTAWVRIRPAR